MAQIIDFDRDGNPIYARDIADAPGGNHVSESGETFTFEQFRDEIQASPSGQASSARAARRQAIADMVAAWQQGYDRSAGMYRGMQQQIIGQGQSAMGNVEAGLAGAGLLNTSARAVGARAVAADTQRSLQDLGQQRAATEYDRYMDLAEIRSNTEWDGTTFTHQPRQTAWDRAMQVATLGVAAASI